MISSEGKRSVDHRFLYRLRNSVLRSLILRGIILISVTEQPRQSDFIIGFTCNKNTPILKMKNGVPIVITIRRDRQTYRGIVVSSEETGVGITVVGQPCYCNILIRTRVRLTHNQDLAIRLKCSPIANVISFKNRQ